VCVKETSNVGFLRTDFELLAGVLLNALNPSCKGFIALFAAVVLNPKPARANNNNRGDY